MGGIYHLVKGTGQTQFSTKFAAKLSFMLQKKLIVRKETWKIQKKSKKYINRNHDLWGLVKTVPDNQRFKILWELLILKTT